MFALLLACTPVEWVTTAVTDGGTWTVALDEAPDGRGITDLPVSVTPATGALTRLYASMPDMGHGSDGGVTDLGGGSYSVEVNFTMSGWWVLDGVVSGDDDEGFRLELEVP